MPALQRTQPIGMPDGRIVETSLEAWEIAYIFYWHFGSGFGNKSLEQMLKLESSDSFFSSAVAKTFKAGWDACDSLWMSVK